MYKFEKTIIKYFEYTIKNNKICMCFKKVKLITAVCKNIGCDLNHVYFWCVSHSKLKKIEKKLVFSASIAQ